MVLMASASILRLGYDIRDIREVQGRDVGQQFGFLMTLYTMTLRCRVGPGPLVVRMTPGYFIAPMRQTREGREAE